MTKDDYIPTREEILQNWKTSPERARHIVELIDEARGEASCMGDRELSNLLTQAYNRADSYVPDPTLLVNNEELQKPLD